MVIFEKETHWKKISPCEMWRDFKGLRVTGYMAVRKPSVSLTGKRLQFVLFQSDGHSQRKRTGGCSGVPILPHDGCSKSGAVSDGQVEVQQHPAQFRRCPNRLVDQLFLFSVMT